MLIPYNDIATYGKVLKGLTKDIVFLQNKVEYDAITFSRPAYTRFTSSFYFAFDCGCSYGRGLYFSGLLEPKQVEDFAYGRVGHINSSANFETAEDTIC